MQPLVLINAVGLTQRLLAHAPQLAALAQAGWQVRLREPMPAVTCTAQATILTGQPVKEHGVVANGWLFRDTAEVRFWQQSNRLMQAEPVYEALRRAHAQAGQPFTTAKLFWWFNQGAAVDISVTPKPHYGVDGDKRFGITGTPVGQAEQLERDLGKFPFPSFWGPSAGLPCTQWIARAAAQILTPKVGAPPTFTLVYLPHLDYDPQRHGPQGCDMAKLVGQLDAACAPLLDTAKQIGARVWVVSEYGHCQVEQVALPNVALRLAGLLNVRSGPFGDQLDLHTSRAFAVCDHQLAHIYVANKEDRPRVRDVLKATPGVGRVLMSEEREQYDLQHYRSGELIALAKADAWFAYPFWLDERYAPDYARTVAIHHKPGYDPCELFYNPKQFWPRGRALLRYAQKQLGFRTRFDVVPLDPTLVKGSHGLPAVMPDERPVLIGDGPAPAAELPMTGVAELLYRALKPE
jgi:predicted AlkP superfamily pyrophosphatase or phosphodiesterase